VPAILFACPTPSQDVAICSSLFLQGVLCAQFAHYTGVNKRDSLWMKLFVAVLALMTALKSVQAVWVPSPLPKIVLILRRRGIMWTQNIIFFENLEVASGLLDTHWVSEITLMLGAINAFYVQMFFCHRLWASGSVPYLLRFSHAYSAPRQYLEIHILSSSASLCSRLDLPPPPPRYAPLPCAQLTLTKSCMCTNRPSSRSTT
jgi:hypothetical protein